MRKRSEFGTNVKWMLLSLADDTIAGSTCVGGKSGDPTLRPFPLYRTRCLGSLCSQINEVQQFSILRHVSTSLTVFLPLKESVSVQFQLDHGRDELARKFVSHRLQRTYVLLYIVVQSSQFFATTLF